MRGTACAGEADKTLCATARAAFWSVHSFSVLPISTKNDGWIRDVGPWWVTSYDTRYPSGQCFLSSRSVAFIMTGAAGARVRAVPPTSAVLKLPVTCTVRTETGFTL